MRTFLTSCFILLQHIAVAQFAPQAGIAGSTAISAASSEITGWANACSVARGYINIATPSLGVVSAGDSANATGAADGSFVCLGDSGVAVLTFPAGIFNGPGADFAVFENGFRNPADSSMAFLELAFVEVSSDGVNYYRFPATSNTPTNTQIPGSGTYMDASLINNLAGKYISMYGTPFDLQELSGIAGLDVDNITHVRLVDVVGAVSGHASTDNEARIINDPYPTNFPTGGFDLDAVGVLHMNSTGVSLAGSTIKASVFPNPAAEKITIAIPGILPAHLRATLTTVTGNLMVETVVTQHTISMDVSRFPSGMYYLVIKDNNGTQWAGKILKY